jgi:putative endonuclease
MDKIGYVYIMANRRNGTLYTGVTCNIIQRVQQHREGLIPGFTLENGCKALVWHEAHGDIESAIRREKTIKKWQRQWKLDLIEAMNPDWRDLWPTLFGGEPGDALPR